MRNLLVTERDCWIIIIVSIYAFAYYIYLFLFFSFFLFSTLFIIFHDSRYFFVSLFFFCSSFSLVLFLSLSISISLFASFLRIYIHLDLFIIFFVFSFSLFFFLRVDHFRKSKLFKTLLNYVRGASRILVYTASSNVIVIFPTKTTSRTKRNIRERVSRFIRGECHRGRQRNFVFVCVFSFFFLFFFIVSRYRTLDVNLSSEYFLIARSPSRLDRSCFRVSAARATILIFPRLLSTCLDRSTRWSVCIYRFRSDCRWQIARRNSGHGSTKKETRSDRKQSPHSPIDSRLASRIDGDNW